MRNALIVLILFAAAASADTVSFTGLPANTAFGTYNGFAYATINGVPAQLLVCDDFDRTTYIPSSSLAYSVSDLSGINPLQYARFADSLSWANSLSRYEQAALLVDGLLHTGPGQLLDLTAEYQYALWHLFTPTVALPNLTARLIFEETANQAAIPNADRLNIYARLMIYTPEGVFSSNQEFLALAAEPRPWLNAGPPSFGPLAAPELQGVPEPSTWILMFAGLGLLLGGAASRRWLSRRLSRQT